MSKNITLKEARKRTKLDLKSDKDIFHYHSTEYLSNVRKAQKGMEVRYGRHDALRIHATKYFSAKGYEVYPRGMTVNNAGTCPDFAFFKGNKITFVECLTEFWVNKDNIRKKRKVEEFAPIIFVIEDPAIVTFIRSRTRQNYYSRINTLAKRCKMFLCNPQLGTIKQFKISD